eukprot:29033-Pelagococcus_subviridis.AAC.3
MTTDSSKHRHARRPRRPHRALRQRHRPAARDVARLDVRVLLPHLFPHVLRERDGQIRILGQPSRPRRRGRVDVDLGPQRQPAPGEVDDALLADGFLLRRGRRHDVVRRHRERVEVRLRRALLRAELAEHLDRGRVELVRGDRAVGLAAVAAPRGRDPDADAARFQQLLHLLDRVQVLLHLRRLERRVVVHVLLAVHAQEVLPHAERLAQEVGHDAVARDVRHLREEGRFPRCDEATVVGAESRGASDGLERQASRYVVM